MLQLKLNRNGGRPFNQRVPLALRIFIRLTMPSRRKPGIIKTIATTVKIK